MLPFNLHAPRDRRSTACGCSSVDHRPLLDARSRLRRRAGQVRRAVPRAARITRRSTRSPARCSSSSPGSALRRLSRRRRAWPSTSITSSRSRRTQAETGKWILLIIGVNVALNFPFCVYGGVISGFQRYDVNNMRGDRQQPRRRGWSTSPSCCAGYGLIDAGGGDDRACGCVAYFIYRRNAYQVFPPLQHPAVAVPARPPARSDRLQHLRVDHRLGEQAQLPARPDRHRRVPRAARRSRCGRRPSGSSPATQRLTNQLNGVLFPADRRQRRVAADGAAPADPAAGHAAVAGDGRADRRWR